MPPSTGSSEIADRSNESLSSKTLSAILVLMPAVRVALAALLLSACSLASDAIPTEEYRSRREALGKSLSDGVVVLFGRTETDGDDSRSGFIQEPNFYYLTGWREPGAILLLDAQGSTVFFLPPHNPRTERYGGPRSGPDDENVRSVTGFENIQSTERFEAELSRVVGDRRRIFGIDGNPRSDGLRTQFPKAKFADVRDAIGKLRLKKSPAEVALIQKSIDATVNAHGAAWKRARPGLYEYQVAATLVGGYLEAGCERSAYAPIVAAGPNANVLHYSANSGRLENGGLLLIDAGAECAGYAADITRTIPVDGRFTPRQRELYEIVLAAQKAVIAAVKPGMTFDRGSPNGLTQIAYDVINARGKDRKGEALGQYFTHKVGHHVGLEVHDAGKFLTYGPLEPGMVITVEPGLYIPGERIGIRIEDMLLVTATGSRLLTGSLPKEAAEIERVLAR